MLYLDAANRDDLAELLATGLFRGVTTNPTILHRAGLSAADTPALYRFTRDHGSTTSFAQATGRDAAELRASGRGIADLGSDVVVKLPCTQAGLTVAREFTADGVDVLVTAVYHPTQMLLAHAAGAQFIAPYLARSTDAGLDGIELVEQLAALRTAGSPRILAASLRNVSQVARAARAGSDDLTVNVPLARALLQHELTDQAVAEFEAIAVSAVAPSTPAASRGHPEGNRE